MKFHSGEEFINAVKGIVDRVTVDDPIRSMRLSTSVCPPGHAIISVRMEAADVENPSERNCVYRSRTLGMDGFLGRNNIGEQVLIDVVLYEVGVLLKQVVLHEVQEWYCFDGKQVEDPHP